MGACIKVPKNSTVSPNKYISNDERINKLRSNLINYKRKIEKEEREMLLQREILYHLKSETAPILDINSSSLFQNRRNYLLIRNAHEKMEI